MYVLGGFNPNQSGAELMFGCLIIDQWTYFISYTFVGHPINEMGVVKQNETSLYISIVITLFEAFR